jgi:enterochelin esterase-like enzyme
MRPLSIIALLACSWCGAQTPDDSKPATSNIMGAQFPRIHADLRVTFRVTAPTAQKVLVQPGGADNGLGAGPYEMTRDEKGVWTVTTPPAVPGFHYYWLVVDGFAANDPSSETFYGYGKESSGIEVPEKGVDFYDVKDVPHGEIHIAWYHSKVTGLWRRAYVYTPPGYDAGRARYPVLYLHHGSGENETTWTKQGKANLIMDNLIAEGKSVPMLVVMETAYATRLGATPEASPNGPPRVPDIFEDVVMEDLIPTIDSSYRTIPDRAHRAMTGTSRGASQALQITSGHLDQFAWIGAFSAPPIANFDVKTSLNGVFSDAAAYNKKVRLLWIGAGTKEERMHQGAEAMHEALEAAGIKHVFYESQGTSHEFQTWRRDLREFAPRLFR